jgi:hypothetical protein
VHAIILANRPRLVQGRDCHVSSRRTIVKRKDIPSHALLL